MYTHTPVEVHTTGYIPYLDQQSRLGTGPWIASEECIGARACPVVFCAKVACEDVEVCGGAYIYSSQ